MVILYIYSACWHMKSVFYECQQLFTNNFCATSVWLRVDWDLASVVQKKGESLQEYIMCFCNKRNVISKVDDKSIVMFFKRDSWTLPRSKSSP
jgi:hypothetical protein